MRITRLVLATLAIAVLAGAAAHANDAPDCAEVRFADIGWTDITATTSVASVVLEGLGYRPKSQLLSIPITYASLKAGDIDVFLGDWQPSLKADRQPFLDDGSIEVIAENLHGAKYTLAVPAYLGAEGLESFADIARFGDGLEGKIYGIEPGNDGNRIISELIAGDRFGLGSFQLVESSEQGMLAQVERHYRAQKPILFLGWAPHPMNERFELTYLAGGDDWFGPDFGGAVVHTNVRKGLAEACPNLGRFLRQLKFTLELENAIMGRILNDGADPQQAAHEWLADHPAVLDPWLAGVATLAGDGGLAAVRAHLAR